MKRRFIFVLISISVITLLLTSCSLGGSHMGRLFDTDGQTSQKRFEQVIEAVKKRDKKAFKELFCKQVSVDTKNIDENISSLFDFFQGDVVSYDKVAGPTSSEEWNVDGSGHSKKEILSSYNVETSKQKYRIAIQEFTVDTANPDNVGGIYSLCIIKAEDTDEQFAYWGGENLGTPGIIIDQKKE